MTPATPVSRRRRSPSRSRTPPATRISASYDRTSCRVRERSGSAPPWLRTNRATPAPTSSADEPVDRRRHGSVPVEGRQPLGAWIEPDGQPVARHRQARAQVVRPIGDRRGQDDPGRTGREGQLDPLGRVDAAGDLERDGDAGRDRPDRLEVGRRPGPGAIEVHEVDEPGAHRHEPLRDPVRSVGRRADPRPGARPVDDPGAPRLEIDRRDDLHDRLRLRPPGAGGGS